MSIEVGDRVPDFTVQTTQGEWDLQQLLERGPLVLVFYNEDATPLCTTQVCAFRDEHETLAGLQANVLAVSVDPLESHQRFAAEQELPFPLAADPELQLARAFDVVSEDGKRTRRAVFVIATDGTVQQANRSYQPQDMEQFADIFRALGVEM